jgi:hypothetical protein
MEYRNIKELREKRMPGSDLDHDYVRQDEKPTDAGNARDEKKKAGNEGGSGRSLAGSAPTSPARDDSARDDSTTDRQWKFLCNNNIVKGPDVPTRKGAISWTHLRP